jgi:hypothetical protein
MAVCLHRSLVEDVVLAVCFLCTQVASEGNPRSGYLGLDNGGTAGVALPHEGIVFVSNSRTVVLGGLPGAMWRSTLKMDQWMMEVTASEVRA